MLFIIQPTDYPFTNYAIAFCDINKDNNNLLCFFDNVITSNYNHCFNKGVNFSGYSEWIFSHYNYKYESNIITQNFILEIAINLSERLHCEVKILTVSEIIEWLVLNN